MSISFSFKVPLLIKFHCSKLDANWWCFKSLFTCLKQLWRIIFSKCPFYLSNVHHSFSKLKRILILMIIKAKHLKFIKFFWKHIWTYLFQICFWPWKFVFNKSYSFLCYLEHGALYMHDIKQYPIKNNYI